MPDNLDSTPPLERRLLVVDSTAKADSPFLETLRAAGFDVHLDPTVEGALAALSDQGFAVMLVEEALSNLTLQRVRSQQGVQPAIAVRGHASEAAVAAAYAAGADDFVSLEAPTVELVGRLRGLLRNREHLEALSKKQREAQAMVELTQALASSLDVTEILHTVVQRIAQVVHVDRVSIVLAPDRGLPNVGFVVATSDDAEITNLQLDLERYPEIQRVLSTNEPLHIEDVATHPLLDTVRATVPTDTVGAIVLLPIVWQSEAVGVLFLRSERSGRLSNRERNFCRVVANATAIALRNARVMQSLRDQTQRVNYARFEAERRLRALKRYANLFTSAADGLAAVGPGGELLFANPRAYAVAGVDEEEVTGQSVLTLIDPADHPIVADVWRRTSSGEYPRDIDLRLCRPDGSRCTVSCAFSALLETEGTVLVSFRDVSDDRATAAELVKTKDFLASLIDASVDAIIATDMAGSILLFNKGAERIYGYAQDEVVGKMHVTQLYPEGRAHEVMRMLKSSANGGVGRLSSIRFDARSRNDEQVPIMLSAAIIYGEDDAPSFTVGIFTDIRERLRVEERLAAAQEKLALTEKHALLAELAGTAAHELNQPLTSIIGYSELLQRKLADGSSEQRAATVIAGEAERMADIVRKIGQITRYETKSYVGQQKILDLDKSAKDDGVSS